MTAGCIIGLTGDVGSGKSTVREWLASRGAAELDADAAVHALLAADCHVIDAVIARFGERVRAASGIDRASLAGIVFSDAESLSDLERILHPAVIVVARSWLVETEADLAVIEAVKLVESGMHGVCDEVWLVVCDAEERRERLAARGWTPEEVDRRMAAAAPLAPKLAAAKVVIDNSGTRRATIRQLETALRRIDCPAAAPRRGP